MEARNYDKKRKPNRKCPYGFTCDRHPWGKHKIIKDCKYFDQCRKMVNEIAKASTNLDSYEQYIDKIAKESKKSGDKALEDNRVECYSGTPPQTSLFLEAIEKHERSVIFLRERGNHQSPESLGVSKQINEAQESIKQLESKLKIFNRGYIAPKEAKIKTCNPKRDSANKEQQSKTYDYYKLQSKTAQFKPEKKASPKCKSIYLLVWASHLCIASFYLYVSFWAVA